MRPSAVRFLYWSPRVLGIAFAVFLSIFALDVFEEGRGLWGTLLGLLIHLIPSAIVAISLWIAWRWERSGAVLFALAAAAYAWSVLPRHVDWAFAISGPLLLIAGLFLASSIGQQRMRSVL